MTLKHILNYKPSSRGGVTFKRIWKGYLVDDCGTKQECTSIKNQEFWQIRHTSLPLIIGDCEQYRLGRIFALQDENSAKN